MAMPRESPYAMVAIDEARHLITERIVALSHETIDIRDGLRNGAATAAGRVLAVPVHATAPIPDVAKSAVDGYAVRSADGAAPRQVVAEITAGGAGAGALVGGAAMRIMTGGAIPPGADAVVMVEHTIERDGIMTMRAAPNAGDAIHRIGQDIAAGELVLAAGTTLSIAEIGLLAGIGATEVVVTRQPLVAVLATGDEVFEPDVPLPAAGVRDSNRYALLAAARDAGCRVISLGIAPDDMAAQRQAILAGLEHADVVLTSGGVSMGTRDLIKPLLAELGTVHFGRVAFKPGKPTMYATVRGKPVFGLPGYPVSSLVSFEVFVRPMLRRMLGDAVPDRPLVDVALADSIRPSPDRPEYQRVVISVRDARLMAHTTGGQGSSRLLSLRGANGLLIVPPGTQPYPAGATLRAMLTGPLAP
jgi:molybdopterin molybdotransferase